MWWFIAGFVALTHFAASNSSAQAYPSKPIRLVIGYVPGGAVDFTARLFGQKMNPDCPDTIISPGMA
jgi:tripartite-type tricarboxylate transporter receptor subunit TctC